MSIFVAWMVRIIFHNKICKTLGKADSRRGKRALQTNYEERVYKSWHAQT
jgi:hypothetical protein